MKTKEAKNRRKLSEKERLRSNIRVTAEAIEYLTDSYQKEKTIEAKGEILDNWKRIIRKYKHTGFDENGYPTEADGHINRANFAFLKGLICEIDGVFIRILTDTINAFTKSQKEYWYYEFVETAYLQNQKPENISMFILARDLEEGKKDPHEGQQIGGSIRDGVFMEMPNNDYKPKKRKTHPSALSFYKTTG